MATPTWRGKHNGLIGDASAMADANDVDQFLGTHAIKAIYPGNSILTPLGDGGTVWGQQLLTQDVSQPFTMSGTAVGWVGVPILPVGNGADLLVTLCADNSGVPGTVITQTRIPSSWIYQIAGVSGLPGLTLTSPILTATDNPLALAQFNILFTSALSPGSWPLPAGTDGSYVIGWAMTTTDSYLILLGGTSSSSDIAQPSAFTVAISSDGTMAAAVPQPAMPTANQDGAAAVVTDPTTGAQSVFLAGGWASTTSGSPALNIVYGAQLDSTTGSLSSWTAQTPLPTATAQPTVVSSNGYLYVIGGTTGAYLSGGALLSTVQYAQVENGQVVSWSTTTPIPVATDNLASWAMDGFIYVVAADPAGVFVYLWYAQVQSDGTLSAWSYGPMPPALVGPLVTGDAGVYAGGPSLSVGLYGQDYTWQFQGDPTTNTGVFVAANGDGLWQYYGVNVFTPPSTFVTSTLALTPRISVPLPATGLTNGGTYHILLQQVGGDIGNYLCTHLDTESFPGNPTALTSPRAGYTWTPLSPSSTDIPIEIYDGAPQAPGQKPLHFWEDSGARITTVARATTPDQRPLGILEATAMPTAQNVNTGFESSLTPWTVTGGTFSQSSVQVYEGQFSCRIVPSGSATQVYVTSEFLPCLPGQSITAATQVWFTNAVTTNFSMSVNWYTAGKVLISTSTTNISVPAATWTAVSNVLTAVSAPSLAYYYTLQPMLSGTPAAGQVWYVDNTIGYQTFVGNQQSSVTELNYPAGLAFPSQSYPVIGTSGLA